MSKEKELANALIAALEDIPLGDQKKVVERFLGSNDSVETIKGLYAIMIDPETFPSQFEEAYLAARQLQPFLKIENQVSLSTIMNKSAATIIELEDIRSQDFNRSLKMRELLADLSVKLPAVSMALASKLTILNKVLDPNQVPTPENLLNSGFMDEGKIATARDWLKNRDIQNFPVSFIFSFSNS